MDGVTILSIAVLWLAMQTIMCFKVKSRLIRFVPLIVSAPLTIVFFILTITITTWDALGYLLLTMYSGEFLIASGLGWGIWAFVRYVLKK